MRVSFFDASHVLPPAMLESYVAEWPAPRAENFRCLLRSGMLGWFSLMLDTHRWTAGQHADARTQFALYRTALRPLIRGALPVPLSSALVFIERLGGGPRPRK